MSNESKPIISVVMAVYNGGKYLSDAIESILNQSFKCFEFIIIDDGSTDNTSHLLKGYAESDARIIIISREDRGLVSSLNEGISRAVGTYIARMDADDISLPDRFRTQYDFLQLNTNVVCVGCDPIIIDEDGDELIHLKTPASNKDIQNKLLSGHCPIEHPSVMYKRSTVIEVGGYREEYQTAEDYDLWLRIGEVGDLANLNIPLIKYRYLNTSISATNQDKQLSATKKACKEALERRGIEVLFTANNSWRQSDSDDSRYAYAIKFGWWAFNGRNKKAAIKYAKRSIKISPWRLEGWKLYIISVIKLRANS